MDIGNKLCEWENIEATPPSPNKSVSPPTTPLGAQGKFRIV